MDPTLLRILELAFFLPLGLALGSLLQERFNFILAYFRFVLNAREITEGRTTSCSSCGRPALKVCSERLSSVSKSTNLVTSVHKYVNDSKHFSVILARSPAVFRDTLRTYVKTAIKFFMC